MRYNWQQPDWPDFKYNLQTLEDQLLVFTEEIAHISGVLKAMPEDIKMDTIINTMVAEAMKTSEIEGEYISRHDVVSSIRNKLGLNTTHDIIKDKRAEGAGELMVDVRNTFETSLTAEKLLEWHRLLLKQSRHINIGAWRKDNAPMQVISGAIGNETVHFEAPPSVDVPEQINQFIHWFNDSGPGGNREIKKAPVRSAIAHLYFESIHPFEDGNGRIGRAIAEKALSQTIGRPVLLSLSRTIEANKRDYYAFLEAAQRNNEITEWLQYFVKTVLDAQQQAKAIIDFTLKKTKFFDRFKEALNERQLKAINKMLDTGTEGFEGGMTAKKYMSITKTSKATATRDLQNLAEAGILIATGGGRNIHYTLDI